jgi:haloalkane dehalogenase
VPDLSAPPPAVPDPSARDTGVPVPDWVDRGAYPFHPRFSIRARAARLRRPGRRCTRGCWSTARPPGRSSTEPHHALVAAGHRVIAPDHLGFGLSDKAGTGAAPAAGLPAGGPRPAPGRPARRAGRRRPEVPEPHLVVHDFGGPIGLAYAIERPEQVARLVVLNTWLWALDGDPRMSAAAKLASGSLGRFSTCVSTPPPAGSFPLASPTGRGSPPPAPSVPRGVPERGARGSRCGRSHAHSSARPPYDGLWRRQDRLRGKPRSCSGACAIAPSAPPPRAVAGGAAGRRGPRARRRRALRSGGRRSGRGSRSDRLPRAPHAAPAELRRRAT